MDWNAIHGKSLPAPDRNIMATATIPTRDQVKPPPSLNRLPRGGPPPPPRGPPNFGPIPPVMKPPRGAMQPPPSAAPPRMMNNVPGLGPAPPGQPGNFPFHRTPPILGKQHMPPPPSRSPGMGRNPRFMPIPRPQHHLQPPNGAAAPMNRLPMHPAKPPPPRKKKPSQPLAHLSVTCIRGSKLTSGEGAFEEVVADPYVVFRLGDQSKASRHVAKGGGNPVWNQEFEFLIFDTEDLILHVEVFDKEATRQDISMGKGQINISDWINKKLFEGKVELQNKFGKPAGDVWLKATVWHPDYKKGSPGAAGAGQGPGPVSSTDRTRPKRGMLDQNGEPYTDSQIADAFRAFDLDKNGFISIEELKHILGNIGEDATDKEIEEMISMVDKNGDGQVGRSEFYQLVTGGKTPPPGLFNAKGSAVRGVDQKAIVEARQAKRKALEEFVKENNLKPESIKKAHQRFEAADRNASGEMNYGMFCDVMQVGTSGVCRQLFQKYDYQRNGIIDGKEVLVALANSVGAKKSEKVKFVFLIYGEDKTMSADDLRQVLKASYGASTLHEIDGRAQTILKRVDETNSGVITEKKLLEVSDQYPNLLFPRIV